MMAKLLFLFFLGIISYSSSQQFFRRDYAFSIQQNAFYKAHTVRQNFSSAVASCKAESSELLLPSSAEEWSEVINVASRANMNIFWVAGHDIFSEGDFVALDGVPVEEIYINWGEDQPSNDNDNEHCITVNREGVNDDRNCNERRFFVCKKNAQGITQNPDCETYDQDYSFVEHLDRCYKFHSIPMNWREAFKICKAEESYLAIINSQAEARYLIGEFGNFPELELKGTFEKYYIHLGFNDLVNHGSYVTIDGKPLSESGYTTWAATQPDNRDGQEHCGAMYRNGGLNDGNCETKAMFVCERSLSNSRTTRRPIFNKLADEE